MHARYIAFTIVFVLSLISSRAIAQIPASPPNQPPARAASAGPEAAEIASGWTQLVQGQIDQAAARAAKVLESNPRNGAALLLAVEAEIVRVGALGGLTAYERWLGSRTLEEPAAVRRVAIAVLREQAGLHLEPSLRFYALKALADDGDRWAAEQLAQVAEQPGIATTRALASLGDETAVKKLLAERIDGAGQTVITIDALGESGSRVAVTTLVEYLKDPRMEVRGAALMALRRIGSTEAFSAVKPLLQDRNAYVRAQAAATLYRGGDESGLPVLQQLLADPSPGSRVVALEGMSSRPDATWLAAVRELTSSADLEARAAAAGLLAPHDPEAATRVLEGLMADGNPAIRELAAQLAGDTAIATSNLASLRRYLKGPAPRARVRAASRILTVTR